MLPGRLLLKGLSLAVVVLPIVIARGILCVGTVQIRVRDCDFTGLCDSLLLITAVSRVVFERCVA